MVKFRSGDILIYNGPTPVVISYRLINHILELDDEVGFRGYVNNNRFAIIDVEIYKDEDLNRSVNSFTITLKLLSKFSKKES